MEPRYCANCEAHCSDEPGRFSADCGWQRRLCGTQFVRGISDVADSLFRIFLEAAAQHASDTLRGVPGQQRPVRLFQHDRAEHFRHAVARKRRASRQHLVEDAPNAQMSARLSTGLPFACSGAMYAAVPRITPMPVIAGE